MINTVEMFMNIYKNLEDEYIIPNFNNVIHKIASHRDLNGMLLLESCSKEPTNIISAIDHENVYLSVTMDQVLKSGIDKTFVSDLWNSGIKYDIELDFFYLTI